MWIVFRWFVVSRVSAGQSGMRVEAWEASPGGMKAASVDRVERPVIPVANGHLAPMSRAA